MSKAWEVKTRVDCVILNFSLEEVKALDNYLQAHSPFIGAELSRVCFVAHEAAKEALRIDQNANVYT
jgi:hypothetical protein